MEQLSNRLDGPYRVQVRDLIRRGRKALGRVQEQDSLLFELGTTTVNAIRDFRIFEKSGRELKERGDRKRTKTALSHLVSLFISVSYTANFQFLASL